MICLIPTLLLFATSALFLYYLVRDNFGIEVALFALIAYLIIGKSDYYGTASWAQGIIPSLYTLFICFSYKWIREKLPVYYILSTLITSFAFGLHLSAGLMVFIHAVFSLIWIRKLNLPLIVVSIIGFLALWVPYLLFQHHTDYRDIRLLLSSGQGGERIQFFPIAFLGLLVVYVVSYFFLRSYLTTIYRKLSYSIFCLLLPFAGILMMSIIAGYPFGAALTNAYKRVLYFIQFNVEPSIYLDYPYLNGIYVLLISCTALLGAGYFLIKASGKKSADKKYTLSIVLMISLLVMLVLQNFTPFNPVARPDILMSYYVWVILFVSVGLYCVKKRFGLAYSLILGVSFLSFSCLYKVEYIDFDIKQDWRAKVATQLVSFANQENYGTNQISVGYDFEWDGPSQTILSLNPINKQYYEGREVDFYLKRMFNVTNTTVGIDLKIESPDYLVVYQKIDSGIINNRMNHEYQVLDTLEDIHVKILKKI